jgi:hypothetical protein
MIRIFDRSVIAERSLLEIMMKFRLNRAPAVDAETTSASSEQIANYSDINNFNNYFETNLRDHANLFMESSACACARRAECDKPRDSDLRARGEIGAWFKIDSPAIVIVEAGKG